MSKCANVLIVNTIFLLLFLFFSLGVRLFVYFYEPFYAVVCINLCCGQIAVSEEFFDGIQIGAPVGEVGGKRVPQYVWAALFGSGDDR